MNLNPNHNCNPDPDPNPNPNPDPNPSPEQVYFDPMFRKPQKASGSFDVPPPTLLAATHYERLLTLATHCSLLPTP